MANSIALQVSELAGATAPVTSLDDWAGDAINKVVSLIPYSFMAPFVSAGTETYSGTPVTAKDRRIFEVSRKPIAGSALNRTCTYISPADYEGELADPNSLYYPTDYDPKWTQSGDAIVVLPTIAGMIISVKYFAFVATFDTTGTSISTIPMEAEYLIVLDLAGRVCLYRLQALLSSLLVDSVVAPTAPTLATVSYQAVVAGQVATITIGTVPSAPGYITTAIPSGIATVLGLFDTAVTADTLSVTTVSGLTLSSVPPIVDPAIATTLTAFDTAMTNEDIELANTQLQKAVQYINKLQTDVQEYNQKVQAEISAYQANTGKTLDVQKTKLMVNTQIPQVLLSKANIYLNQYQAQIQENLGQFNKDLEKFKADVQKVMQQAELAQRQAEANAQLTKDVSLQNAAQAMAALAQNDQVLLSKYERDIGLYGAKVQTELGSFQANIGRMSAERDRLLALMASLKNEYYEHFLTKFGVNLKGQDNGK